MLNWPLVPTDLYIDSACCTQQSETISGPLNYAAGLYIESIIDFV